MPTSLRQSTTATIKIGPFVSPSDALTPFTAGGFTVKLSKNSGALAARNDATAITHDADGYYLVELNAADTNTLQELTVEVPGSAGNYLPIWKDYEVLAPAVFDAKFGTVAPSTYAGTDTAGTTTLLSRVTAAVALASQIPASFTSATFASPGVFATAALANAPTGGGGDPWATALPGSYGNGTAGKILGSTLNATLVAAGLDAVTVESGLNARQALSIAAAAVAGKLTGAAGPTTTISAAGVPNTVRIVSTVDTTGRTSVTLTPPA